MSRSQFDELPQVYEDMFDLDWRVQLEMHSVLSLIGDVTGKSVLDIGCGSGVYSRRLNELGADRVVGFDASEQMLAHASRIEETKRQGIEYVDEPPLSDPGSFDLAIGVYVLPYAENYSELVDLCSIAGRTLRPGGRFLTLPINPDYDPRAEYYTPYGLRMLDTEPRADASRVRLELRFGRYQEDVIARYWTRPTLERALHAAGFDSIDWPPYRVSAQGISDRGEQYWRPYLDCPHAALIDCRKS